MDVKEGFLLWFTNFFDKKSPSLPDKSVSSSGVANNEIKQNLQLAKELHKPIIRKFYTGFKDNICGANLADMQLISNFDKGFRFLLCVTDIFSKYAWVVPLKKVDAFQKILDKSGLKPNKIWVDK